MLESSAEVIVLMFITKSTTASLVRALSTTIETLSPREVASLSVDRRRAPANSFTSSIHRGRMQSKTKTSRDFHDFNRESTEAVAATVRAFSKRTVKERVV